MSGLVLTVESVVSIVEEDDDNAVCRVDTLSPLPVRFRDRKVTIVIVSLYSTRVESRYREVERYRQSLGREVVDCESSTSEKKKNDDDDDRGRSISAFPDDGRTFRTCSMTVIFQYRNERTI